MINIFKIMIRQFANLQQLPLSIIVCDLNALKLTNDAFGHLKGDELLKKVSEKIKNICREEDLVARWGGDEFVLLLPQSNSDIAISIANRIRIAVEEINTGFFTPSIAVGYAIKSEETQSIDLVFKQAEEKMYENKIKYSNQTKDKILTSLQDNLRKKSSETSEHCKRVKQLSITLCKKLGLDENKLHELSLLSEIHDIGKIVFPEEKLHRTKVYNDEESLIRKHTEVGYQIASTLPKYASIADGILYHHEWWDGSGYPQGLKGEEIPITARIINLVDYYDKLINNSAGAELMKQKEALEEIEKMSGRQFDPQLVKIFINTIKV